MSHGSVISLRVGTDRCSARLPTIAGLLAEDPDGGHENEFTGFVEGWRTIGVPAGCSHRPRR